MVLLAYNEGRWVLCDGQLDRWVLARVTAAMKQLQLQSGLYMVSLQDGIPTIDRVSNLPRLT